MESIHYVTIKNEADPALQRQSPSRQASSYVPRLHGPGSESARHGGIKEDTAHSWSGWSKTPGKMSSIISPMTYSKLGCCLLISVLVAAVVGLSVALSVRKQEQVIERRVCATCPRQWIGFASKCFYFSEDMRNWTHSNASCLELEAQLAQFNSLEEMNILRRYKGASAHWIGLCRESSGQPWKWTDNTEYNNTVPIRGEGECAYLNDNGISSSRKYIERKWICSKPSSYTVQCPVDDAL